MCIGAFFLTKRITSIDGTICKMQLWDTADRKDSELWHPCTTEMQLLPLYVLVSVLCICIDSVYNWIGLQLGIYWNILE